MLVAVSRDWGDSWTLRGANSASGSLSTPAAAVHFHTVPPCRLCCTDIGTQLQCVAPLLDALPEPAALSADIVAADASVGSVLHPALAGLSTQLGSLAERLEPGSGAYAEALQTAAGAQELLFGSPNGLITQANVRDGCCRFGAAGHTYWLAFGWPR